MVSVLRSEIRQPERDKYHRISLYAESKEQYKQVKQKQTHRYREQTNGCQVDKVKRLRSTDWWLQNSRGDVKPSTGNTVNNTAITMCGARWGLEVPRGTLCKVHDCLTAMPYS